MGSLHGDVQDMDTYALANAIGAATIAQLKLDQTGVSSATGSSMADECQRTKLMGKNGQSANLNILRIAFFLHIYYENQDQGGVKSLLFLREAITIAQIMGLHRESSYVSLSLSEQQIRRRILWLLFVTERYRPVYGSQCYLPNFKQGRGNTLQTSCYFKAQRALPSNGRRR